MALANDPDRADRNRAIIQDRRDGYTYEQLAHKYSLSTSTAYGIVKEYTDEVVKPAAEALVQLEIDRLERLLLALQPKIDAGNVRAIEVAIKLSESLRKLTGVDAAMKLEVEHTANAAVTALEEKLRKAAQINVEGTD